MLAIAVRRRSSSGASTWLLRPAVLGVEALALCSLGLTVPVRGLRRLVGGPTRSVWLGTPILTLGIKARAERLLGVRSISVVTHTYHLSQAFDYDLSAWRRIPILGRAVGVAVFAWVCAWADRVHCFHDRGLLPGRDARDFNHLELAVFRRLGIQVFLWAYGADVRSRETTRSLGEPNCCTDCACVGKACICAEPLRMKKMRRLSREVSATFSMGDMIEYTPGSHNGLFYWPIDLTAEAGLRYCPEFPDPDPARPLRVVHAANHRMFKGTRYLEEAVAALRAEGEQIELILVENVPNVRALEIYRSADVIFDQCLIGFHGYFALEAMALGKPVMCFIRKPESYLLAPEECPIINVRPDTLKEDIKQLLKRRNELGEIGRSGRAYVERYFSLEAFAARLAHAYAELGITP